MLRAIVDRLVFYRARRLEIRADVFERRGLRLLEKSRLFRVRAAKRIQRLGLSE